jgi:hypothetical protein
MLSALDATDMPAGWCPTVRMILSNNVAFMVHHHATGHAGVGDTYRIRPLWQRAVLQELLSDTLRANGR